MKPADLLVQHEAAWRDATRHPFLDAVRDGTLVPQSFATWLVQDYFFVNYEFTVQVQLLLSETALCSEPLDQKCGLS